MLNASPALLNHQGLPPLGQTDKPFGQVAGSPGHIPVVSEDSDWRHGAQYQTEVHDVDETQESQGGSHEEFDFRTEQSISIYARRAEPWSVYLAELQHARSSMTSVSLQKDSHTRGPLTDEIASIISGAPAGLEFDDPDFSVNPGRQHVGLESPSYAKKSQEVARAAGNTTKGTSTQVKKSKSAPRSKGKPHPCQQCDRVLNCKSDLVKHTRLHDKPFRCDVSGCDRVEGFITLNDLDRHKKSKHPNHFHGKTRSFQCAGKDCKRPKKIWPRLDNFRSHISKMHPKEDVEDVVKRSRMSAPTTHPKDADTLMSIDPSTTVVAPPVVSVTPGTHGDCSSSSSSSNSTAGRKQHTIATSAADQPRSHRQGAEQALQASGAPNAGLDVLSADAVKSAPAEPILPASLHAGSVHPSSPHKTDAVQMAVNAFMSIIQHSQPPAPSPQSQETPPVFSQQHAELPPSPSNPPPPTQRSQVINALEQMLLTLKKDEPAEPRAAPEATSTPPGEAGQTCTICQKRLKRTCDMNKHLKRHTKPYGCTFTECDKVFGSKNDWKRHENSQHFQGEFFKCQQSCPGEKFDKCSFVTQHESVMESHLIIKHYLNKDAAKEQVTASHVGRYHQSTFWCGFCGDVIPLENQGVQAWDERFNHIDKHFMKEHRGVKEWVDPETYKTKGQMQKEDAERRRKRNADLAQNAGVSNPRKRAGSVLSHEAQSPKHQKRKSAGNVLLTCCQCDEVSLLNNSPARCAFCGAKWCDACSKEMVK